MAQNKQYKMIPVDEETYEKLKAICEAKRLKQGAQVSLLVNVEWEKLKLLKIVPVVDDPEPKGSVKRTKSEKSAVI